MKKLSLEDILPLSEYEGLRDQMRKEIIELKKDRRVQVGEFISLIFENRKTMIFQIQEMMRAEHIYNEDKILEEITIYNPLIPDEGQLSATLFIEITEEEKIKKTLDRLQGLDHGQMVYLELGKDSRVPALFEEGRSTEEKISSVHYIKFFFNKEQQTLFSKMDIPATLKINHPNYQASTPLSPETHQSLLDDLNTP